MDISRANFKDDVASTLSIETFGIHPIIIGILPRDYGGKSN